MWVKAGLVEKSILLYWKRKNLSDSTAWNELASTHSAARCGLSRSIFLIYIFIGTPTSTRLGDIHTRVAAFFLFILHNTQHRLYTYAIQTLRSHSTIYVFFFGLNWVYFHFRSGLWNFLCEPRSTTRRWNTFAFNWFEFDGRRTFFFYIYNFWDQWIFE